MNALVETTKQILVQPGRFFRAMPTSGGVGSPLLYAVIIGWIGTVLSSFYFALFQSVAHPAALGAEVPEWMGASTPLEVWGSFVANVVFGPVMQVIFAFVAGGVFHVSLLLVGGAQRDFEATFRVVCYSQAPNIFAVVPFCGWMVAPFWTLALCVIGLTNAHRIGTGKAVLAVLLPVALFCCCCAAFVFLVWGAVAGTLAGLSP